MSACPPRFHFVAMSLRTVSEVILYLDVSVSLWRFNCFKFNSSNFSFFNFVPCFSKKTFLFVLSCYHLPYLVSATFSATKGKSSVNAKWMVLVRFWRVPGTINNLTICEHDFVIRVHCMSASYLASSNGY
jgi:hypothetical protein